MAIMARLGRAAGASLAITMIAGGGAAAGAAPGPARGTPLKAAAGLRWSPPATIEGLLGTPRDDAVDVAAGSAGVTVAARPNSVFSVGPSRLIGLSASGRTTRTQRIPGLFLSRAASGSQEVAIIGGRQVRLGIRDRGAAAFRLTGPLATVTGRAAVAFREGQCAGNASGAATCWAVAHSTRGGPAFVVFSRARQGDPFVREISGPSRGWVTLAIGPTGRRAVVVGGNAVAVSDARGAWSAPQEVPGIAMIGGWSLKGGIAVAPDGSVVLTGMTPKGAEMTAQGLGAVVRRPDGTYGNVQVLEGPSPTGRVIGSTLAGSPRGAIVAGWLVLPAARHGSEYYAMKTATFARGAFGAPTVLDRNAWHYGRSYATAAPAIAFDRVTGTPLAGWFGLAGPELHAGLVARVSVGGGPAQTVIRLGRADALSPLRLAGSGGAIAAVTTVGRYPGSRPVLTLGRR